MTDRIEKMAISIVLIVVFVCLITFGLLGWGFVELVQWLTSK